MRAYKKLPQLYDVSVLVATLDQNAVGRAGPLRRAGRELRQRAAPRASTTSTPTDGRSRSRHRPRTTPDGVAVAPHRGSTTERQRRAPSTSRRPAASRRRATRALLEVLDRDGQVRQAWRVEPGRCAIGRALDNDVVLTTRTSRPPLRRSTRGRAARAWSSQVGDTRQRRARRPRAPRRRRRAACSPTTAATLELHVGRIAPAPAPARHALAARAAAGAGVAARPALAADRSRSRLRAARSRSLSTPSSTPTPTTWPRASAARCSRRSPARAIWCGAWALLSKIFTRQSHFGWHVRVFADRRAWRCSRSAALPRAARVRAVVAVAHRLQLRRRLRRRRGDALLPPARASSRRAQRLHARVAATGFVVGVALTLWFNVQRTGQLGEELYMNHLFPPQLRLARPVAADALHRRPGAAAGDLDKKAKEQRRRRRRRAPDERR